MKLKTTVNLRRIIYLAATAILLFSITVACKKSPPVPEALINNSIYNFSEDATGGLISLPVTLSGTYDKTVSIGYTTSDGTAVAGKDYEAVTSGTVTFQPGQRYANIPVILIQDTARKEDAFFSIQFSNPVNCTLKGTEIILRIQNTDYDSLVWSDEFSSSSLSTSVWNYELGGGGWGNNELETYTDSPDNVHIDSGYLHITALNLSGYSSGRITTKGKKEFTHGRVVIRARLPEGIGLWPAMWMLGSNFSSAGWPSCGEIDMMELLGDNPSTVYGTVHWDQGGYASQGGSYALSGGKFTNSFHTFTLVWAPNHFEWLVDNYSYLLINKSQIGSFPFDLPQFFIFNVAVGGNWPGSPNGTTVFPQNMIIDYIRVYQ